MKPELSLVLLEQHHAPELFELINDNRDYLRQWLQWLDTVQEVQDVRNHIDLMITQRESGSGPNFVIMYDNQLCGTIGLHSIDKGNSRASVGYWLAESFGRKGIMTESMLRVLDMAFGEYKLNKIELRCAEFNHRSRGVAERLGFQYEATLRECEWLYTHYVNHAVYSLLGSEYSEMKNKA